MTITVKKRRTIVDEVKAQDSNNNHRNTIQKTQALERTLEGYDPHGNGNLHLYVFSPSLLARQGHPKSAESLENATTEFEKLEITIKCDS